ncbi:MAG: hypothetical protein J6C55_01945 [Oscillospiraceae bacterium]|nr:hypothetical protein [Oscillospiraceae bacterium]
MNIKNLLVGSVCCLTIFSSNFINTSAFTKDYYDLVDVLPRIESYIASQADSSSSNKIILITVRDIKLESDDKYQRLHDILQSKFPQKNIFDVYIKPSGQIIIPENNITPPKDDERLCNQEDINFKNKLSEYGVKNVSVINENNNKKIPSEYHRCIAYSISKIYNKYFYVTDKYINHVNNTLFSNLEMADVQHTDDTVGEFIAHEDKIVLSPALFNNNNKDIQELIEQTISHEIGHAIELSLCEKVFKDLNLNNISQNGLKRLALLYFCDTTQRFSSLIMDSVLERMNAPKNITGIRDFIKDNLSAYANTNPSEFFAEAIAGGVFRDESKNKNISSVLDEEIKNIIKSEGATYQKLKDEALRFLKDNNIII